MNLESCTYLRIDTNPHQGSLMNFDIHGYSGGRPAESKVQRTVIYITEDKITLILGQHGVTASCTSLGIIASMIMFATS